MESQSLQPDCSSLVTGSSVDRGQCEQPDIHSSSPEYAARFSGPIGKWIIECQNRAVLEMLNGLPVKTILDVGGGHAQISPQLAENGYEVTILGSAPECANLLRKQPNGERCRFEVGELTSPPFPDRSFDAVICLRQLSHLTHWEKLVAEAARVSRTVVILDYPTKISFNLLYVMLFPLKKWFEGNTRTFSIFSDSQIAHAFEQQGLRPYKREPQFLLPIVFHRFLRKLGVSATLEWAFRKIGLTAFFGSPVIVSFLQGNGQIL